ncbi:hypothetical protein PHYPSEUDO_003502 [Phytophthora pseudosyringae]|uniref:Uncharacterized protein n=1 Tax=Phytophthora pseudosyringae TaxID=221518 RepID=A0A8T1VQV4_9STRA|nr:hypothetical protein PHYPSEUDO_003502 [Phytophthora pseudosyringae]
MHPDVPVRFAEERQQLRVPKRVAPARASDTIPPLAYRVIVRDLGAVGALRVAGFQTSKLEPNAFFGDCRYYGHEGQRVFETGFALSKNRAKPSTVYRATKGLLLYRLHRAYSVPGCCSV